MSTLITAMSTIMGTLIMNTRTSTMIMSNIYMNIRVTHMKPRAIRIRIIVD